MATLTEAAYYTRKAVKYGSVLAVILIILRIAFAIFSAWWRITHPPPPLPATVAFGNLPPLPFPEQEVPELNLNLETITGETGEFGPNVPVHPTPERRASLLDLERATELAERIQFRSEPRLLSGNTYRFTKDSPLPTTLDIDIVSDHFVLDANWRAQPDLIAQSQSPSQVEAVTQAKSWLKSLEILPEDLAGGEAEVTFLKVSGTEIVPALSQSEAQFARVDLFRSNLRIGKQQEGKQAKNGEEPEEHRILPLNPEQGVVSITISGESRARTTVIQAEYKYIPIDYEESATYPVRDPDRAWKQLQEGEGYYASLPENLRDIAVHTVSLEYLDPPRSGLYLQPIYVFEGDGDFIGYVPAIDEKYIEEE